MPVLQPGPPQTLRRFIAQARPPQAQATSRRRRIVAEAVTRPEEASVRRCRERAVDFVREHGLAYGLVVHPSTGFKHDPEGESIRELLSYCRQKKILVCTYREIYQWLTEFGIK